MFSHLTSQGLFTMRIPLNNQTRAELTVICCVWWPHSPGFPSILHSDFQELNNDTDPGPPTASPEASLVGREAQQGQAAAPQALSCLLA